MMNLKGKQYLPVAARVAWFRDEHPAWGIVTEAVRYDPSEQLAIFRTSIFDESGRIIATATKMEDARGFADYAEKAETGSVGRALALCGYGTLFATELDEGESRIVDAPMNFPPQSIPGVRSGFDQAKKPESAQQTRTAPARQGSGPKDLSGENCSECGVALSNAVLKFSCDKYGNPLCFDHQQGRQSNPNSRQSHVPVRDTPIPPPMPESEYNEIDLSDPFAEG